jgi:hypothetical protein
VLGKGDAHVREGAGDDRERAEKQVQRFDLEFLLAQRLPGLGARLAQPAQDVELARRAGRFGDALVEVGAKLVAAFQRSPVPGEWQVDWQRQEPCAHAREGVEGGAVARVGAGASKQRIRGVKTHRLKLRHPQQRCHSLPVRQVAVGDLLKKGHISSERLRCEGLQEELTPGAVSIGSSQY